MACDTPINLYQRTNDPPVVWTFDPWPGETDVELAERYVLTLVNGGTQIVVTSDDPALLIDPAARRVVWHYTTADALKFPTNSAGRYDLLGTQGGATRLWAGGVVSVESWLNPRSPHTARHPSRLVVPGPPGASAFEIWKARGNVGTEADFLLSLRATAEGDALVRLPGAVALSGHRCVRMAVDGVRYVSVDDVSHANTLLGITTGASYAGAPAAVQTSGVMVEPSWNWSPGPVFAGLDGMLVQTPPRAAFEQRIGIAAGPTRLLIDVEAAFLYAT